MTIQLFEIQNGKAIPGKDCYVLRSLLDVMEAYPKDQYMKIYLYFFYMTCPDKTINPFFHEPADSKEDIIIKEVGIDFSMDELVIKNGLEFCMKRYETETVRAHRGMKNAMDRLGVFLAGVEYSTGRDGSITAVISALKNFADIRESYKKVNHDLEEEQSTSTRGGANRAYDDK